MRTVAASAVSPPASGTATSGSVRSAPVSAATSRATPMWLVASGRFGVTSMSRTASPGSASWARRYSEKGWPAGASSRTMIPPWSSPRPSSSSAQIIPKETSPRIFPFLMLTGARPEPSRAGSISVVPTVATGTVWPAATFGAPQTIWTGSPSPRSTSQTRSRSAFGCGRTSLTWPTTTPSRSGAVDATPSTSRPAIVKRSASASGESPWATYSASQFVERFMVRGSGFRVRWVRALANPGPQTLNGP